MWYYSIYAAKKRILAIYSLEACSMHEWQLHRTSNALVKSVVFIPLEMSELFAFGQIMKHITFLTYSSTQYVQL